MTDMKQMKLYRSNTIQKSDNAEYRIECKIDSLESFENAIKYDNVAALYKGYHRSNKNYIESDCLMFDCDNTHSDDQDEWKAPDDVADTFPDVPFYFANSKNNMKVKDGKEPRPKFHVYTPIPPVYSYQEYSALKDRIIHKFPWFDTSAADAARYFDGTSNGVTFIDGDVLITDILDSVPDNPEYDRLHTKEKESSETTERAPKGKRFKLPERIPVGERDATLLKLGVPLANAGATPAELVSVFEVINGRCDKPLPIEKLQSVAKSAYSYGHPKLDIKQFQSWLDEKGISLRLNEITRNIDVTGLSDAYAEETQAANLPAILFDSLSKKYKCGPELVTSLIPVVAGINKYNPVTDLLRSVTWNGEDVFSKACKVMGILDDPFSVTLFYKWLLQAIVMSTNTIQKAIGNDGMLSMVGPQGYGKTSLVEWLGMRPDLYKLGQSIDSKDKDTKRRCVSAWIIELGEVETTLKSDIEDLKNFITSPRDEYRLPYGRADIVAARRSSMIATCNSEQFLIDPTGSRRFWTISIDKIDRDELMALDALQLWAQMALEVEKYGEQSFRLTPEEQTELAKRNTVHDKPLKAEDEVRDIIEDARAHQDMYVWEEVTVSQFKERYTTLRRYSVQQVGAALARIPSIQMVRTEHSRLRRLPMLKTMVGSDYYTQYS